METECFVCGNTLEEEEIESPNESPDGKTRCDKCYFEAYFERCVISDDWIPNEEVKYFMITDEYEHETGYYEILSFPFYISNIIGGDEIFSDRVKKISDLHGDEEDVNGYVCEKCAFEEKKEENK